jgi:endonuclease/exonuclease/phosphatase (EEP) superfamily protein YafD
VTRLARRSSGAAGAILPMVTVAAAAAALAADAGGTDPRLDVLAQFAPIYAAAGLIGLLAAFWIRRGRALVISASVLALGASAALIVPEFVRDAGPVAPPDAPGQIRVVHLNALRTNSDVGRVADWLIAQHPDVVTITETRPDLRDLLVRRAGWAMAGAHGTLIVFTHERYVVMNRPQMPPDSVPSFVNATYATSSGPMEVITAHFGWPTEAKIAGQQRGLASVMGRLPHRRTILTGDFNATPWSATIRRLDGYSGLIRRDRALPTWPAQVLGHRWPWPIFPIDHVYAGDGWATVRVQRGPWLGSDHYPVVVTLAPVAPR